MPGVGLRPLPLLPPGSLASQVCSSSQELCRLPQRRPLPRETPDSLRRLVTGMRIRSGRKCCPAAPRRWSLCPLVCVASVARGAGASLCCPLPPPGGGVPSASCLLLMRRRHPEPGAEPRAEPARVLAVPAKIPFWLHFQHGGASRRDTGPTRFPAALPRRVSALSVRASDSVRGRAGLFPPRSLLMCHYWT